MKKFQSAEYSNCVRKPSWYDLRAIFRRLGTFRFSLTLN
jgi:hypothetical protein